MLVRDLKKEGWVSFEKNDSIEISNLDVARLVFDAMKKNRMFNRDKINKNLEKRFMELSTFEREIEGIINIQIIRGANVNNNVTFDNTYLIIDDKNGVNVVLDLENGIDDSYRVNRIFLNKNSKIERLYSSDVIYHEKIKFAQVLKVIYYPRATLINDYTGVDVCSKGILEIVDTVNNKIYVDCYGMNLYCRGDNYSIINDSLKIDLFISGKSNRKIPKIGCIKKLNYLK